MVDPVDDGDGSLLSALLPWRTQIACILRDHAHPSGLTAYYYSSTCSSCTVQYRLSVHIVYCLAIVVKVVLLSLR